MVSAPAKSRLGDVGVATSLQEDETAPFPTTSNRSLDEFEIAVAMLCGSELSSRSDSCRCAVLTADSFRGGSPRGRSVQEVGYVQ